MPTQAFVSIEDFDGEPTTVTFWVQDIGAGNYASVTQDIDEVKDAIIAAVRGEVRKTGFTKTFLESFADVTDEEAQRETKWLVTFRDTTQFLDAGNTIANAGFGKIFTLEIGTALLTGNLVSGTNLADLSVTEMDALRDAIQANVRSPYNHTANAPSILVLSIEHVGRNT